MFYHYTGIASEASRQHFCEVYGPGCGNDKRWRYRKTFYEAAKNSEKEIAYIADIVTLVNKGIISRDVSIILGGSLNEAGPSNIPSNTDDGTAKTWASSEMENFAKALPNATVTANRTRINASEGLNSPVIYKNGEKIKRKDL